ncbi:domain of unknown function DUF1743 [Pyrolobus fumarii 1A]|uniref:tRNA(Ile2) 2-agmatinylcytidine synthetase TiaS n=1 Tax=Pyrolobus fumarii (strain DSM 11204 / 1A) TaxID=694429 RepID=G0EEJ0_PYRF1|nr:DUF1743 domain-containing protein [Pyrolobus fumarii]AEM38031.1 domain of unknown function DUF1743 [Pyrolobus fumarii 1A]
MLLAIALDGADSPSGGCTTHLASLIFLRLALRENLTPADYPWLVRLNPSIPMKTRGNGSVTLWFSTDSVERARRAAMIARDMLVEYAESTGSKTKASIVAILFSDEALPRREHTLTRLYYDALTRLVPIKHAWEALNKLKLDGAEVLVAEGNSIVGALAGVGARLDFDHTFELLVYMPPRLWGTRPQLEQDAVRKLDHVLGFYGIASIDYATGRALIQPHGPDPVLAGVRSDTPEALANSLQFVPREFYTHAIIYRSNQHTGVHIRDDLVEHIKPYDCIRLHGVLGNTRIIGGGHVIAQFCDDSGCIDAAFYRETGELRHIASRLLWARVTLEGCVRVHRGRLTVNVERLVILDGVVRYEHLAPPCPKCNARTTRVRDSVYKCSECGTIVYGVKGVEVIERLPRMIVEPPPSAWHHLYMPLARITRIARPRGLKPTPSSASDILLVPGTNVMF